MSEKFEKWATVELFGHQRIAGKVSEQTIGGCSFVRVDVPAVTGSDGRSDMQGFTKLYGNGAIYGITFVDEETARLIAAQLRVQPIDEWAISKAIRSMAPGRVSALISDNSRGDDEPY